MKTITTIITALILLTSCNDLNQNRSDKKIKLDSTETKTDSKPEKEKTKVPETVYFDYSNSTFTSDYTDSTTHIFSNSETKDNFKIYVPKGLVTETTSFLLITNSFGDTIHLETFPTSELIYGYKLEEIKSDSEVIKHIKDRISSNLDKSSFIDIRTTDLSLITDSEPDDFEDHETFLYCKQNDVPIYVLRLGNENSTFYGYSNSERKAVPIIYCC
ncbi:hypothetical protein Q4534_20090 [Cyclobacterium sp. 1_MG-2023]|uniref:hypothetical protein n=1 Tax=Cyclobacterium sp. 1_MG-2023 TaxID=3062681 RepID=UPI0026E30891|nr:hypothetical protein [Cyclobacterium sp. 1_MG-2023]MDO6439738.1 hypothetical protein [Cyclobacterium sp. 1_MG-2023]